MKILRLCHDLFGKSPRPGLGIKDLFREEREEHKDDRSFFHVCSQYLGGRGYNEFLDYALLAVKLNHIHTQRCGHGTWELMSDTILTLLGDDRHDMYQNIPMCLDTVAAPLQGKCTKAFWSDVVEAMIDCINVAGTGDASVFFEIKEV